ncbi:MAG: hypothetical protein K6B68_01615 [Eubacterium sp.]|nr:hypothetical protein [Eubacterium sp.]
MEYIYAVDEAQEKIIGMLAESTGWKYLKSKRCLRKAVKDLVFEIYFFSSKWNESHKSVEINADFRISYKKYGKLPVDNIIAFVEYRPDNDKSVDGYWYDISTEKKLLDVYDELNAKMQETAVLVADSFEKNFDAATEKLFTEYFNEYSVHIDFVADILGVDAVREKAQEIYDNLTDIQRSQVIDYRNGDRSKAWMLNRNNLKYILDNNLVET